MSLASQRIYAPQSNQLYSKFAQAVVTSSVERNLTSQSVIHRLQKKESALHSSAFNEMPKCSNLFPIS